MIKRLLKDNFFHIQYWYMKEVLRAKYQNEPLGKILKYYAPYMKSNLDNDKSPLVMGLPWITFEAIDFLKDIVKPEMKVFEFGSGGSTRFFTERVAEVHSVEHHEGWYEKVKMELRNHSNLDLKWIPGKEHMKDSVPTDLDEMEDGLNFGDYSGSLTRFEDNYFDMILVDGKVRNACISKAIPKLKSGGWLLVDNSNRKAYQKALDPLESFLVLRSFGPVIGLKNFTQTSFYKIA